MKLVVDSRFREPGYTQEDYLWRTRGFRGNVRGLRLVHADFSKTVYNVITGFNNTFDFTDTVTATTVVVQIASGFWNGVDLATEIQSQLSAGGITNVNVGFEDSEGRLFFIWTGAGTAPAVWMHADQTPASATVFGLPTNLIYPSENYTWPVQPAGSLGTITHTLSTSVRFYMRDIVQLTTPEYLLISVDVGSGTSGDVLTEANRWTFVVPFRTTPMQTMMDYNIMSDFQQTDPINTDNIVELRVSIRPPDARMNPYFSFNGADHTLIFEML